MGPNARSGRLLSCQPRGLATLLHFCARVPSGPHWGGGGQNPRAVAAGEVELGLSLISDIVPIEGAELLGPLPPEIQYLIVERAGVGAATKETEAASAFIKFLKTPPAQKAFRAQGLEPVE